MPGHCLTCWVPWVNIKSLHTDGVSIDGVLVVAIPDGFDESSVDFRDPIFQSLARPVRRATITEDWEMDFYLPSTFRLPSTSRFTDTPSGGRLSLSASRHRLTGRVSQDGLQYFHMVKSTYYTMIPHSYCCGANLAGAFILPSSVLLVVSPLGQWSLNPMIRDLALRFLSHP